MTLAMTRAEPPAPTLADQVDQAIVIVTSGENLFEAYRILRSIDPERLAREAPRSLGRYWWAVGLVTYELGRYSELETAVESILEMPAASDGSPAVLQGLYYRASGKLADPQRFESEPEAVADLEAIVARAGPGSEQLKLLAVFALGKLQKDDRRARDYLEQARSMAETLGQDEYLFHIRVELARRLARTDPPAGYARLQAALKDWRKAHDPWSIYGWEARLEVVWAARPAPEAVAHALDLLDRIESRRRDQEEHGTGSMGFFSVWVRAYRRVIGLLLRDPPVSRDRLELAFTLSERMRARVLLEELRGRAGVAPACADPGAERKLHDLRRLISARQRTLLGDTGADQEALRREIDGLMLDEEAVRREIRCETGPVEFVDLAEVERSLAPDEALLVFQTGNLRDHYDAYDGGSWAFVVTAGGSSAVPLPEDRTIHAKRDAFLGSLRRRDGSDAIAAAALHGDLFRDIESRLPAPVRHIIIVPHGSIHGIPFAALRPAPEGRPLVDRFRFSYTPSATIWSKLHRAERPAERTEVLAFADPDLGEVERAAWRARGISRLSPLPWARWEGSRLLGSYGGVGRLLEGPEASEQALSRTDLDHVALLLFAAHAVVDERSPRRSAIVLARGTGVDDGLLQPPEISDLSLGGAVVALSGCQSAMGMAIEGEGLLSLARSFFEAGSVAVVGNLWPARDEETGRFFGELYGHLADGEPLATALQRTQRARLDAGDPTEAWAGIVALGDGSATLPRAANHPTGAKRTSIWLWLVPGACLAYLIMRVVRSRTGIPTRS